MPDYGRQFDAAIIPYRLTQQVMHANPLKLREYLAMGKPMVSVRTPETEKFADVIEVADSREEFLAKLDKVVGQPDGPEAVKRRMDRVASLSWEARVAEVLEAGGGVPGKEGGSPVKPCRVVPSNLRSVPERGLSMDVVNIVAQTVFWACLALTLYAYLVYPVCIWLLARWFPSVAHQGAARRRGTARGHAYRRRPQRAGRHREEDSQ